MGRKYRYPQVNVRLSASELKRLDAIAADLGKSRSSVARSMFMRRLRTLESRVQRTRRQAEDDTEKIRHIKEAALRTVESQKELISRLGAKNVKYAALLKRARDRLKAKSSDESLIAEIDDVLTAKMKTGRLTMGSCEETNAIWEGRP